MHHRLSLSTHTVELAQLRAINEHLSEVPRSLRAADIGMEGRDALDGPDVIALPAAARLADLVWDGPPQFPYIHAHFLIDGRRDPVLVELHSQTLRELSHRLGLHHVWGA